MERLDRRSAPAPGSWGGAAEGVREAKRGSAAMESCSGSASRSVLEAVVGEPAGVRDSGGGGVSSST